MKRCEEKTLRDLRICQIAAEMYEKGQPAEIAKILGESETEYVVSVLKYMKRKSAARNS
jgi:hypothetical protein